MSNLLTVLFVEDDAAQRHLIATLFARHFKNVTMLTCPTIAEANKLLPESDVVILDLTLHDSDIEDSLEWLTQCNKPVVIYSGTFDAETIDRAVEAGALFFVCKGSSADQLMTAALFARSEWELEECRREVQQECREMLSKKFSKFMR